MKRDEVDWDEIGRESLRIHKMRADIDKWLEEFAERNGYAPTRIWTPIYPAEWESGEQWIGCIARGREILFPTTQVFHRPAQTTVVR